MADVSKRKRLHLVVNIIALFISMAVVSCLPTGFQNDAAAEKHVEAVGEPVTASLRAVERGRSLEIQSKDTLNAFKTKTKDSNENNNWAYSKIEPVATHDSESIDHEDSLGNSQSPTEDPADAFIEEFTLETFPKEPEEYDTRKVSLDYNEDTELGACDHCVSPEIDGNEPTEIPSVPTTDEEPVYATTDSYFDVQDDVESTHFELSIGNQNDNAEEKYLDIEEDEVDDETYIENEGDEDHPEDEPTADKNGNSKMDVDIEEDDEVYIEIEGDEDQHEDEDDGESRKKCRKGKKNRRQCNRRRKDERRKVIKNHITLTGHEESFIEDIESFNLTLVQMKMTTLNASKTSREPRQQVVFVEDDGSGGTSEYQSQTLFQYFLNYLSGEEDEDAPQEKIEVVEKHLNHPCDHLPGVYRDWLGDAQRKQVVIIGGGIAGLASLKTVLNLGLRDSVLVEATNRLGGRLHTVRHGGWMVEEGAHAIQGDSSNPVFQMAFEHKDLGAPLPNVNWEHDIVTSEGDHLDPMSVGKGRSIMEHLEHDSRGRSAFLPFHDQPLGAMYARRFDEMWGPTNDEKNKHAWMYYLHQRVSGKYGVNSWMDMAARDAANFIDLGQDFSLNGGMDKLVQYLLQDVSANQLRLSSPVCQVFWDIPEESRSLVIMADGSSYLSEYVISSLPVGTLKDNHYKTFFPPLPRTFTNTLSSVDAGVVDRIALAWPQPWWGPNQYNQQVIWRDYNFPHEMEWMSNIIEIRSSTHNPSQLEMEVFGDAAEAMENMDPETMIAHLITFLRTTNKNSEIPLPSFFHRSKWRQNIWTRGSYHSYMNMNAVSQQVEDRGNFTPDMHNSRGKRTLFFSGEHTSTDRFGTVDGAMLSGVRAARWVMDEHAKHENIYLVVDGKRKRMKPLRDDKVSIDYYQYFKYPALAYKTAMALSYVGSKEKNPTKQKKKQMKQELKRAKQEARQAAKQARKNQQTSSRPSDTLIKRARITDQENGMQYTSNPMVPRQSLEVFPDHPAYVVHSPVPIIHQETVPMYHQETLESPDYHGPSNHGNVNEVPVVYVDTNGNPINMDDYNYDPALDTEDNDDVKLVYVDENGNNIIPHDLAHQSVVVVEEHVIESDREPALNSPDESHEKSLNSNTDTKKIEKNNKKGKGKGGGKNKSRSNPAGLRSNQQKKKNGKSKSSGERKNKKRGNKKRNKGKSKKGRNKNNRRNNIQEAQTRTNLPMPYAAHANPYLPYPGGMMNNPQYFGFNPIHPLDHLSAMSPKELSTSDENVDLVNVMKKSDKERDSFEKTTEVTVPIIIPSEIKAISSENINAGSENKETVINGSIERTGWPSQGTNTRQHTNYENPGQAIQDQEIHLSLSNSKPPSYIGEGDINRNKQNNPVDDGYSHRLNNPYQFSQDQPISSDQSGLIHNKPFTDHFLPNQQSFEKPYDYYYPENIPDSNQQFLHHLIHSSVEKYLNSRLPGRSSLEIENPPLQYTRQEYINPNSNPSNHKFDQPQNYYASHELVKPALDSINLLSLRSENVEGTSQSTITENTSLKNSIEIKSDLEDSIVQREDDKEEDAEEQKEDNTTEVSSKENKSQKSSRSKNRKRISGQKKNRRRQNIRQKPRFGANGSMRRNNFRIQSDPYIIVPHPDYYLKRQKNNKKKKMPSAISIEIGEVNELENNTISNTTENNAIPNTTENNAISNTTENNMDLPDNSNIGDLGTIKAHSMEITTETFTTNQNIERNTEKSQELNTEKTFPEEETSETNNSQSPQMQSISNSPQNHVSPVFQPIPQPGFVYPISYFGQMLTNTAMFPQSVTSVLSHFAPVASNQQSHVIVTDQSRQQMEVDMNKSQTPIMKAASQQGDVTITNRQEKDYADEENFAKLLLEVLDMNPNEDIETEGKLDAMPSKR